MENKKKTRMMCKKGAAGVRLLILLIVGLVVVTISYRLITNAGETGIDTQEALTSCNRGSLFQGLCKASCEEAIYKQSIPGLCDNNKLCCIPREGYESLGIASFGPFLNELESCNIGYDGDCNDAAEIVITELLDTPGTRITFQAQGDSSVIRYFVDDQAISDPELVDFKFCVNGDERDEMEIKYEDGAVFIEGFLDRRFSSFEKDNNMICAVNS